MLYYMYCTLSFLLLVYVQIAAEPYVGTQCNGVFNEVPVNLTNSYDDSVVIDDTVEATIYALYNLTVWNTKQCVSGLRKHFCMLELSKYSYGTIYCKENCLDLGPECAAYYQLAVEYYPLDAQLLYDSCDSLPPTYSESPYCFPGSPANHTEREPVCPLPLVIPDANSYARDGLYIYWIDGTACAFPCQPVIYSDSTFENQKLIFSTAFGIAFIFSSLLLFSSMMIRQYNLAMYALGTTNGAFWMTIFMSLNQDNELTCSGNAGVDQYNSFCVFSGFMLLASLNWFAAWSFNITFRVWASVSRKIRSLTLKRIDKYYWLLAIFLPSLLFINLGVGNIGYGYDGGTSCICYNLYELQPKYWHYITTFSPAIIFAVILPGIMLVDTLRIVATSKTGMTRPLSVASDISNHDNSISDITQETTILQKMTAANFNLKKALQIPEEQWRILKFIFFGVAFTMFFCCADLYATYGLYPKTVIADATTCVLLNATPNPKEGLEICGKTSFEIDGIWAVYALVLYGGIFGTIPPLIFGFKPLRKITIRYATKIMKWNQKNENNSPDTIYDFHEEVLRRSTVTSGAGDDNNDND